MSQPPPPVPDPQGSDPEWIEDPGPAPAPPPPAAGDPSETLVQAWSQLREQQTEFDRRNEVLDALRQRLAKYLDHKNRTLLDRQRALDVRQQQNERERQYLNDAKLHVRRNLKQEATEFGRLQRKQHELDRQGVGLNDPNDSGGPAVTDAPLLDPADDLVAVVDTTPIDGPVVLDGEPTLATVGEPPPWSAPAPPLLGNWRLAVAVLCAVVAAGVVLLETDFMYRSVTTLVPAGGRPDASTLQDTRAELAVALQDLAGPPRVALDPDTPALEIAATIPAPHRQRDPLRLTVTRYLESAAHAHTTRIAELEDRIANGMQELTTRRGELEALVTELADRRLSAADADPRSELEQVRAELLAARTAFDQVLADATLARDSLTELERAEDDAAMVLPDSALHAAEDADAQLRQDREELRFHMRRLRDHLLQAFTEFPQKVEAFTAATEQLSSYLQTTRLDVDDPATRAVLDSMQQRSARLEQLVADFDRAWGAAADRLQRLLVDPRKQQTLAIQKTTEKLVRDLVADSTDELKALQEQQQKYLRSLENRAERFEMTAELKARLQNALQQQYVFATLAKRVLPSSDIQLDTIMHRVTGLARRVRDRQSAVAESLRTEHRATLLTRRGAQATELRALLDNLEQQRQVRLAHILAAQDRLLTLSPVLEEHGAQSTMMRYALDRQKDLAASIADTERDVREATTALERAQRAGVTFELGPTTIADWPVNFIARLSQVGATGVLVAAILFAVLTQVFRPRLHPLQP